MLPIARRVALAQDGVPRSLRNGSDLVSNECKKEASHRRASPPHHHLRPPQRPMQHPAPNSETDTAVNVGERDGGEKNVQWDEKGYVFEFSGQSTPYLPTSRPFAHVRMYQPGISGIKLYLISSTQTRIPTASNSRRPGLPSINQPESFEFHRRSHANPYSPARPPRVCCHRCSDPGRPLQWLSGKRNLLHREADTCADNACANHDDADNAWHSRDRQLYVGWLPVLGSCSSEQLQL